MIRDLLKERRYADSFEIVGAWLREAERPSPRRTPGSTNMHRLARAAAVILLLGACALPVPQNDVIGYFVRAPLSGAAVDAYRAIRSQPWAGDVMVFVTNASNDAPCTLFLALPRASTAEARATARAMAGITGRTAEFARLEVRVHRPLFRAAAGALLGQWFAPSTFTDAEIREQIGRMLDSLAHGSMAVVTGTAQTNEIVAVPADASGTREILAPDSDEIVLLVLRR